MTLATSEKATYRMGENIFNHIFDTDSPEYIKNSYNPITKNSTIKNG